MYEAKSVSEMSLSLNRVLRITISFLYLYVIIFILFVPQDVLLSVAIFLNGIYRNYAFRNVFE
jgi:hypothetical protein